MRKFLVSAVSCLLTIVTYAQSTCETRVDAHQQATTRQRVAYCLTQDAVATDASYSGLVFSGVSSHQPQAAQDTNERPTAKSGYYNSDKVTISRNYVATTQFPQATQANIGQAVEITPVAVPVAYTQSTQPVYTQSAQPVVIEQGTTNTTDDVLIVEPKFEYVSSPMVPVSEKLKTAQGGLTSVEHFMADEVNAPNRWTEQAVAETKAGVKARQTKPGRTLKQTVFVEEQTEQPVQSTQTEETVPSTDATYLYNEQTDIAPSDVPDTLNSYNPYEEVPAVDAQTQTTSNY